MLRRLAPLLVLATALGATPAWAERTDAELAQMLETIDDRQRNSGDYHSVVYIETKESGRSDLVYLADIYRRDASDKLVILFSKPQSEAGKGYLRVDQSLFLYDPTVGKWERRTERERIGGTDSNRADFDESRLAEEYTPAWLAQETLGQYTVDRIKLTGVDGEDVAYPVVELWIDQASGNILKRQDFALSGRLMRTTYYPEWRQEMSPSKGAPVWFPREIRIYDEVEKGNQTVIVFQSLELDTLEDSIFTKAWLEARSR
jgi:hypothetical protein